MFSVSQLVRNIGITVFDGIAAFSGIVAFTCIAAFACLAAFAGNSSTRWHSSISPSTLLLGKSSERRRLELGIAAHLTFKPGSARKVMVSNIIKEMVVLETSHGGP